MGTSPQRDTALKPAPTTNMSSLLKPFSVCEGPCESCGVRRGCPSSVLHQQPPSQRLAAAAAAAATGLGSLPAHQRSYAARRNLAAAAVGGRKITHPGKAILAGTFCNADIHPVDFPSHSSLLLCAPHILISICRPLRLSMQELGQNALSQQ